MKPITGESRATTWLAAMLHLDGCTDWQDYNLVLEILDPMRRDPLDQRIEDTVDKFLRAADKFPLTTVAETIFPASEYRRHGPDGVYKIYPDEIYPKIKRLPELKWGTYAYRLVRRVGPSGTFNPLAYCVEKIRGELAGKGVKTACYELSLADVALDLPLYEAGTDQSYHISGPCLSHISLKITRDRKLLLTALYRSHYYVQKALGNLLGLARLQAFICEQTQLAPGPLVCVSTYATLESDWSKTDVRALMRSLTRLSSSAEEGEAAKPRRARKAVRP